jgi:opacity protein-like surface antigen
VQFGVRGGWALATAGGDLFKQTFDLHTIDRNDFGSGTVGADMAFRITPRLDLAIGAAYAGRSTPSEFRKWTEAVEVNGREERRPIEQTNDFRRIPVSGSLKYYLAPRGRSLGEFAWVPSRFAPYVGAGAGTTWYRFKQTGDFVLDPYDVAGSHDIVSDRYQSSGWAPSAHAMAGLDMTLTPHVGLTSELRYAYARGRLRDDYQGFDDGIDLSGAMVTAGLFFRF